MKMNFSVKCLRIEKLQQKSIFVPDDQVDICTTGLCFQNNDYQLVYLSVHQFTRCKMWRYAECPWKHHGR